MRENNAANSGNAVIANPELGPTGPSVETLHGTPRTGEEKVRPGGNYEPSEVSRNDSPASKWSVELHALQLSMDFPHALFGVSGQMLSTGPGQIQELIYQVESGESTIGHQRLSEDSENLTNSALVGLTPDALWGTQILFPIKGALHAGTGTIGDLSAELGFQVLQDGLVVVPLGDDGLSEEVTGLHGASLGLIGAGVLIHPNRPVSPEEAPELSEPLGFDSITVSVANIHAPIISLSSYQVTGSKDLQDEILAGVGTYTIPNGITEEVFRKGFAGTVAGANVWEDGNITIDASDDAIGAVHSQEAVVAVSGMTIKTETRRDPSFGGGADEVFMTDEYSFVERSASNWAYGQTSDALAPTS